MQSKLISIGAVIAVSFLISLTAVTASTGNVQGKLTPTPSNKISPANLGVLPPTRPISQHLAVPAYFDPSTPVGASLWTQLQAGVPIVGLAIIDPDSGPSTYSPYYLAVTQSSQAKKIMILGYVHTSWAARSLSIVENEIDEYYAWYQVDGIFVDEASASCTDQPYYQQIYNYIKGKGGKAEVVINPGMDTAECYMSAADIIMNFDNGYGAYTSFAPSSWVYKYPATRFCQVIYGVSAGSQVIQVLANSRANNAGWIYYTDDNSSNPWEALPTYWTIMWKRPV